MDNAALKKDDKCHRLEIFTLGRFMIRYGERTISEQAGRSKKIWELFKYLLLQRDQVNLAETIVEKLWPNQDYTDPNLALRSLVYRLRQTLAGELGDPALVSAIAFTQGGYRWDPPGGCALDLDQFESLCRQAARLEEEEEEAAAETYLAALALYRGDLLPECSFQEWIIPLQSYYRRLYLDGVYKLLALLKKSGRFQKMISVCESALMVEYYEEKVHLYLLEALLEEGNISRARQHYEEVTATFYRELGAKPSPALRTYYRLLKMDRDNFDLDLSFIQEGLRDRQEAKGAFFCDPEVFRYLYNLERIRGKRSGRVVYLGLLTITGPDLRQPPLKRLKEAMSRLEEVLKYNLRKGDVITRWNEAQYLLLLSGLNTHQAEAVLERIELSFKSRYDLNEMVLLKKQQCILPPPAVKA